MKSIKVNVIHIYPDDAPTGKKLSIYQRTFTPIHTKSTAKFKPGKLAIFVSVNFDNINVHYINLNICTFISMHK
jgi:hypothetical protein